MHALNFRCALKSKICWANERNRESTDRKVSLTPHNEKSWEQNSMQKWEGERVNTSLAHDSKSTPQNYATETYGMETIKDNSWK